ncbi:amidase [Vallicoccus soli]|uniref:Amidase n=1 Tax=Vallicoccus soli TaxID=2339232 RepID=A0A3A3Z1D0_9ACTN|nr:amidase [Vallicoccus soli]RJK96392.1 amidase [Vallicoccus soli]
MTATDDRTPEGLDAGSSRRLFLARLAALSAAGATGATVLPGVAQAAPAPASSAPDVAASAAELADPASLTVGQAATAIRGGRLTSQALVRACIERIAAHDGTYRAFNTVLADEALARAKQLDRRRPKSPLHGIPLAIKDNYFTEGVLTTANSFIFADFVPPYDATAVARLEGAGGVVVGKTQMGPLATSRATTPAGVVTTLNAWAPANPDISPAGSSSGSATATAVGMALSSIGTQTGGSITGPAEAQGLTGLKPTMGRVSLHGIIPLTYTRDHPGPIARDAMDAAIMLTAMAGPDPSDFRTLGLPALPDLVRAATPVRRGGTTALRRRTRIGVQPDFLAVEGEVLAARQAYLAQLASIPGATVVEVPFPDEWELLTGSAFNNVRLPERAEPFLPWLKEDLRLFGVSVLAWLGGLVLSGDEYLKGQRAKTVLFERTMDQVFEACDVVVQTGPVPFDILGLPEIAFPIGFTAAAGSTPALPVGTILGGQPYAEDRLLEVVAAYQAVTDWHTRRAPLPPTGRAEARRAPAERSAGTLRLDALEAARQAQ